ncbi:RNA polymerase sigma factor SigY [Halobacillus salinarum]|uniref:RNA polymerase sigma factor SigY n=1 Tax=Halobacillus salinarum TaxID=2932257 RepID=A0ABY4EDT4_9BACI|nr:RNA polymerase sigma factor SigY [Halobacillus salinarum]UOQ42607.1 RNA polymerase sigma factor SigY [Halobacillus salinarum]
MEHEEDHELIIKALNGEEEAYALLFERYYSFLYKYLLKLTLDEHESKDLAQETMMKCYTQLTSYKEKGKFSTWMISIASHLYMDGLRKRKRELNWLREEKKAISRKLNWQAEAQGIQFSEAFSEFNELSDDQRVPILLHHYYGYTYEEISRMLRIKTGTVKSRVHNGLKWLRQKREEENG